MSGAFASDPSIMVRHTKTGLPSFKFLKIDSALAWAQTCSKWPLWFGLACCAMEMMAAGASHYDWARFGMEFSRPSPRQADLMIVCGRLSRKMVPVARRLYDQMAQPKWVITMGDCACSCGLFNNHTIVQGVDEVIPVDVYVAGCPPHPDALLHGILTLFDKIQNRKEAGSYVRYTI
jgi:NADH-quinone oxidoreductase subunit B